MGLYGSGGNYIRPSRASSARSSKERETDLERPGGQYRETHTRGNSSGDAFESQLEAMIKTFPKLRDVRVLQALMDRATTPAAAAETTPPSIKVDLISSCVPL